MNAPRAEVAEERKLAEARKPGSPEAHGSARDERQAEDGSGERGYSEAAEDEKLSRRKKR